ncbi:uncharacterized protein TRIADDRAFT_22897 [Trichoplax adhaerens]|uniref:Ubiquitin carboxyl-terminal hydrolase n=1 Tax=Trichoplax adhaerens TaxID=10228 RepID=B3RSG3_TRIAD|nr:hypothetical protein TRIADDRAFT_22897 [Trichoplax adhaerens]EDV26510.1 hypothetical protein TRIADDRAFT_22897 [Trichoplax adhaerens]|eukprot:XP_002110506.1 hypothetical protein TRIADDRAFT_22897 [Trichoplax adhaerens]
MECPHIEESVKLTPADLKNSNCSLWTCEECETKESPWICLSCGNISCGRYVKGHAKKHYEDLNQHCLCLDPAFAVYCYSCDEYIINDSEDNKIQKIRDQLQSNLERLNKIDAKRYAKNISSLKIVPSVLFIIVSTSAYQILGLKNLGNTCYLNAILQSLSNIDPFCRYFKTFRSLTDSDPRKEKHAHNTRAQGDNVCIVDELRKVLDGLGEISSSSYYSPNSFLTAICKLIPRFRGYHQQDAHEFMRYLLDRLHTELGRMRAPYYGNKQVSNTIVTTLFRGSLLNEVNCLVCDINSRKTDSFLDLSLDIPSEFISRRNKSIGDNDISICKLTDCLSSFTELEKLEDSELYYCSSCTKKQLSTKQLRIKTLPRVLCLHLKRFRWSSCIRKKLDIYVEFPMIGLDMKPYLTLKQTSNGRSMYDLIAVVEHHGSGYGSGHYTAYAYKDGWYHFNDSTVSVAMEEHVIKCKAYILFYVQRE